MNECNLLIMNNTNVARVFLAAFTVHWTTMGNVLWCFRCAHPSGWRFLDSPLVSLPTVLPATLFGASGLRRPVPNSSPINRSDDRCRHWLAVSVVATNLDRSPYFGYLYHRHRHVYRLEKKMSEICAWCNWFRWICYAHHASHAAYYIFLRLHRHNSAILKYFWENKIDQMGSLPMKVILTWLRCPVATKNSVQLMNIMCTKFALLIRPYIVVAGQIYSMGAETTIDCNCQTPFDSAVVRMKPKYYNPSPIHCVRQRAVRCTAKLANRLFGRTKNSGFESITPPNDQTTGKLLWNRN